MPSVAAIEAAAVARLTRELAAIARAQLAELRRIASLPVEDRRLETTRENLAALRTAGDRVADALDEIGSVAGKVYREASAEVLAGVAKELRAEGLPESLAGAAAGVINAARTRTLDAIVGVARRGKVELRAALTLEAIGGVTPHGLIAELARVIDRSVAQTITEVDTSLMALDRAVFVDQAKKGGVTKYEYAGPVDSLTRPWCRRMVGRVFTEAQLKALRNDAGQPALAFGGGYNCRHRWEVAS